MCDIWLRRWKYFADKADHIKTRWHCPLLYCSMLQQDPTVNQRLVCHWNFIMWCIIHYDFTFLNMPKEGWYLAHESIAFSVYRCHLTCINIAIINIIQSNDLINGNSHPSYIYSMYFIFIMGSVYLERCSLYWDKALLQSDCEIHVHHVPRSMHKFCNSFCFLWFGMDWFNPYFWWLLHWHLGNPVIHPHQYIRCNFRLKCTSKLCSLIQ